MGTTDQKKVSHLLEPAPPWKRRRERLEDRLANMRRRTKDRTVGSYHTPHVYFAYSAGRIKIGTSLYAAVRTSKLSTQSPHPVTIIMAIPGGVELEAKFHELLAGVRRHGEWFALTNDMRRLLHHSLCRTGMRKFKKAEAEFLTWLKDMEQ